MPQNLPAGVDDVLNDEDVLAVEALYVVQADQRHLLGGLVVLVGLEADEVDRDLSFRYKTFKISCRDMFSSSYQ